MIKIRNKKNFLLGLFLIGVGLAYFDSLGIMIFFGALFVIFNFKKVPVSKVSVVRTMEAEEIIEKNLDLLERSFAVVMDAAKKEYQESHEGTPNGEFYEKLQQKLVEDPEYLIKMFGNYAVNKYGIKV